MSKERTRLHAVDREWLAISPFCIIATSDAEGNCDASPEGDPAGHLVHVLDDATVAIAERPGNKRADGYLNVLANPHAGIISLVPAERGAADQRPGPAAAGRAGLATWSSAASGRSWPCSSTSSRSSSTAPSRSCGPGCGHRPAAHPDALPSHATLVKRVQETPETLEELEEYYAPANYQRLLY